jgi:PAS domain S-box-containing protein
MNSVCTLLDQNEEAACVVNAHGRMLAANPRFCRMFGFEYDEAQWHYFPDLYRHDAEWKLFHEAIGSPNEERHFLARLRNRKGRSFKCKVTRLAQLDTENRLVYVNSITKIESPRDAILPRTEGVRQVATQVFLTTCSSCRRVQDANGQWIETAPAASLARRSRQAHYCPACAAKIFPGVFDRAPGSMDEEPVAAAR